MKLSQHLKTSEFEDKCIEEICRIYNIHNSILNNKQTDMNKNNNERFEIDFESLKLTESEETIIALNWLDKNDLKIVDKGDMVKTIVDLPFKEQNDMVEKIVTAILTDRKARKVYFHGVKSDIESQLSDVENHSKNLSTILNVRLIS